jgi:hypothetical protein
MLEARRNIERLAKNLVTVTYLFWGLVHEEKLHPFDMFHKLEYIEQCNFVITFIQSKDGGWLRRGGCDGLDSELYLFILDSRQLEAAVGSNDLFILPCSWKC